MDEKRVAPQGCCAQGEDSEAAQAPGVHAKDAGRLCHTASQFKALADGTRLAILQQLRARGEICACDLVACCAVAQPTVSHHLRVLREAGLVRAEKRGQWVYYSLDEERLAELRARMP